tara:strand:+ start:326 stop:514 length:189 start_codon:yes stop_codon:yes gene_type:complete
MKNFFSSISVLCLLTLSISSNIPLQAGGCSSHKNKKAEIECKINDEECIQEKAEKKLKNFEA